MGAAEPPVGSHTSIPRGMGLAVTLCLVWLCGQTVAAGPHSLCLVLPKTCPEQGQSQHHTGCLVVHRPMSMSAQWSVSSFYFILAGLSGVIHPSLLYGPRRERGAGRWETYPYPSSHKHGQMGDVTWLGRVAAESGHRPRVPQPRSMPGPVMHLRMQEAELVHRAWTGVG